MSRAVSTASTSLAARGTSKDVAGFANARTGGSLLAGFTTRRDHDSEIIDQLRPVPMSLMIA
jgi:hypothetical protein